MSAAPSLPDNVLRTGRETNGIPTYTLQDEPVENLRPLKVIVVGAGFSGIYCGIRIPERLRNVELVIYEKNASYGGTWWENRYPGVACDIPSHSYQYSFNPNPRWSALYAPGKEIREYLEETVKKYSVDRFVKLSHRVEECQWDEDAGKWRLKIKDLNGGGSFEDAAEVLIHARGGLNEPSWPDIEGLNTFKGKMMHSAIWDESYDFKDRKVALVGLGSSSIQILPKLQQEPGAQLSVFARGRTWISPSFGQLLWDKLGLESFNIPEKRREEFVEDKDALYEFRMAVEADGNGIHGFTIRDHPIQKGAREAFEKMMKDRLASKPEIIEQLIPSFAPGCRRLTPGPGYLEALTEPNVSLIKTAITRVEAEGIRTADGQLHPVDAIVCATGFKAFVAAPFPNIGRNGVTQSEHWAQYPRTYLSVATNKFPNQFYMLGPNGAIGAGSLTIMMETTGDYIVKCIRKLQKENYKSMEPKAGRVDDFIEYARAYFPGTVYKDECRSWYKRDNGDVTGLWPGSTLHYVETMRSPRWEDWEYQELRRGGGNQLAWLGNGWTDNQSKMQHLAWYLEPQFLGDKMPLSPRPEESDRYAKRPFSH